MKYKKCYDRQARETSIRLGDWILVCFPQEETGRNRKLSRPWRLDIGVLSTGGDRAQQKVVKTMARTILSKNDPNLTCAKESFPEHNKLHVHQSRVCPCPPGFLAGYYWYGTKRKGPGRPPRWVEKLLTEGPRNQQEKR